MLVESLNGAAGSLANAFLNSAPSTQSDDQTEGSSRALIPHDELELSSSGDENVLAESRADAKLSLREKLRVGEDGRFTYKSRSHLRYNYEFEAADGSRVRIQARANLRFSAKLDEDGELRLKTQAKVHLSVLQETVGGEVSSLLTGEDAQRDSALAEGLETFNKLFELAAGDFLDGTGLDGDSLVLSLVDAFNGLAGIVDANAPRLEEPAETSETAAPPEPAVEETKETPDAPTLAEEPIAPAEPLPDPIDEPIEEPSSEEDDAVAAAEQTPVAIEADDQGDADEVSEASESAAPAETEDEADDSQATDYHATRMRLRLKFVESLTSLINVFDGGDEETAQVSRLHASRLQLSVDLRTHSLSESELSEPALDASA